MNKFFWFLFSFFIFTFSLLAQECKVYGISSAPQKLNCHFGSKKMALQCDKGVYYFGKSRVIEAYHLDVERGPLPLVFQTNTLKLMVYMWRKVELKARLSSRRGVRTGFCEDPLSFKE